MPTPAAAPDLFAEPHRIPTTRRALAIRRLAAYYDGEQYDGRPDWFSGTKPGGNGDPVPLRERKPCVIYPLPKAACNQATRFTFGEGRYPSVQVAGADDDEFDGSRALSGADAETLTAFLAAVTEASGLKSAMRAMLRHGLSQRTAVACLGAKRGQFVLEMPRACDCAVEFEDDDPAAPVTRLVWCYPFQREVVIDGQLTTEAAWFRRDWTDTEVVAYLDAKDEPGKAPAWVRDEKRTVKHGFGFCPVVWVRNLPEPHCQEIDGVSLYEGLEDELDALNFALSQRHRGIVYFGTPQAYETGVSDDEQPAALGRTARPAKSTTAPQRPNDGYRKASGEAARKKAPDEIWSYENENAAVGVIETTGKAFEVTTAHVLDIRARILEAINVILLDPSSVGGKGELTGKALALIFAPLLALVDELRDCWWSNGLCPVLSMILRINAVLGGRGILVPKAATVAAMCKRFNVAVEGGRMLWAPPRMVPSWGAYFSPSPEEVKGLVDATSSAQQAGLIRHETAIRNVAGAFGETEVDELVEDAERAEEEAEAAQKAMLAAGGQPPSGNDDGEQPPAAGPKGKPAKGPAVKKARPAANAMGG